MNHARLLSTLLLGCGLGIGLCACDAPRKDIATPGRSAGPTHGLVLDGNISDWPTHAAALADTHHLYVRFSMADESFTLQAAPRSVVIYLDIDGDATTGRTSADEALAGLGVDLELVFSPDAQRGGKRQGAKLFALDARGTRTELSTREFDVVAAPTVASEWYEARLSRTPAGGAPLPRAGLLSQGKVRGVMAALDEHGAIEAWADTFEAVCPMASTGAWPMAVQPPPGKPARSVRVVSYNVHHTSPLKDASRFQRILQMLDPDVVLLQEWEEGSHEQVAGWFTAMMPDARTWNVVKAPGSMRDGGGVAIATRLPIADLTTPLVVKNDDRDHHVRWAVARILTPVGEMTAASVHLKCCGSAGSPEDVLRAGEARAINAALARLGGSIVIGGDLNLVGTWGPILTLGAGIDLDQSDLAIARAHTFGDNALATWRDATSPFTPGRLDYVLYSDARWVARNAFVLDTSRMSEELLARLGLDADDTDTASDHMPVVVDLQRAGGR